MLVQTKPGFPDTPSRELPLQDGRVVIVDARHFEWLSLWTWYARKSFSQWYACRGERRQGKVVIVRMHRLIAKTPPDLLCHHINGISLDNRVDNLLNITPYEHAKYFSYR